SSETLDQIVVTAMRRPEDVRDVPITVSTFTPRQLDEAGVGDIKHLAAIEPSLGVINSISQSFGQVLRLRGMATSGGDIGLEPSTGVTIDNVPLERPSTSIGDLIGIERIEILRGPQGTLFGKNSTAGMINIMTKKPGFTPEISGSVSAGNW